MRCAMNGHKSELIVAPSAAERSEASPPPSVERRRNRADFRSLPYEQIIARAKAERAIVVAGFLRSLTTWLKSACHPRSLHADRFKRAPARSAESQINP